MITIDATLQTAQDGDVHQPIIELMALPHDSNVLPFDGNYFNDDSNDEVRQNIVTLSSGRIATTFFRDETLIVSITDEYRSEWTETELFTASQESDYLSADLCELADGNIGIVLIHCLDNPGTDDYILSAAVISQDGAIVSAFANIQSHLVTDYLISDPFVIQKADGVYLMAYSYQDIGSGNYYMALRTSNDFATWSAATLYNPSGLEADHKKGNPSLIQTTPGAIFMGFDYEEVGLGDNTEYKNVYYVQSTDGGATWSAPVKMTEYDSSNVYGYHPVFAERNNYDLVLAYTKKMGVLWMTADSPNACTSPFYGTDFHYDPASDKLFVKSIYAGVGNKILNAVTVIDVSSWEIEKCYNAPGDYNSIFASEHVWWHRHKSTGAFVCAAIVGGKTAMVIDYTNDYVFTFQINEDNSTYSISKNVSIDFGGSDPEIKATFFDDTTNRLYIYWDDDYLYTHKFWVGYIDISEAPDDNGYYSWHSVLESAIIDSFTLNGFNTFLVIPEMDYIIIAYNGWSNVSGALVIIQINSGGIVKHYNSNYYPDFQFFAAEYPVYYNSNIYCSFEYTSLYGDESKKGLMQINLTTDNISYYEPDYKVADSYQLAEKIATPDGRILIGTESDGIVSFNTGTGEWVRYNNDYIPGLTPTDSDEIVSVAYDPVRGTIFGGNFSYDILIDWAGIIAFSEQGDYYQGFYSTGTYSETPDTWAFGSFDELTETHFDREGAITVDPDNGLWSSWTRQDAGNELSAVWDKETASFDLTPYLVSGKGASLDFSVESASNLSFALANGHLFDQHNSMSVFATYLKKGNLVTVRMGELVGGIEYWQNQGTFRVSEKSIRYSRGQHPIIDVQCSDLSDIYEDVTITASQYYDGEYPETILEDLVELHGGFDLVDIEIPEFSTRHQIWFQVIDESLGDVVEDILSHFGYFQYVDTDGDYTARPFDLTREPDHIYTDATAIIDFTPDDSYSNYINKVVVSGEGRDFLEVMYEEESITGMAGTIGWWGEKITKKIWYGEDHERKCRNPRLDIIQSVKEFELFLLKGGGSEYISDIDEDEKWVEITIEGPDLVAAFIAAAASVVATGAAALGCGSGAGGGPSTCGIFIALLAIETSALSYILSCVASYSYEIYANPIGEVKQTCQDEANDYDLQQAMNGQVVISEIEDPFCYDADECGRVAEKELEIVMAQRERVSFKKVAHLQDEIGDIIQITHPYSGKNLRVFITNLTRSYIKPSENLSNSGGVFDQISGWVA